MACYPGQPPPLRPEELDPLSDSEADYKDFSAVQQNCHSTQVIVKWLELNYHYEEGVCLPRSTIYEHYVDFCERENIQPVINAASFGKLIRQQFSSLTTRRLGTRGKSKYHYFGLGIKPTSLYYNEEYFKRQKEGLSRKEPDSKKVHPVYPKENPSAVLPPFPDINQLKVQQEVPKDKLATFMVMYRTHCQRILDSVSRANFNEVEDFLLHFWQAMPPHLLPIMASTVVVDLVALCDTILYSVISSVLIISPVQSFPESLLQDVLKFCGQLGPWLDTALTGLPEALRHIKQKNATTFVKTLKRQIAIMELAKATRKALQREDQLTQLFRDWEGLDMHAVLAHVLFAIQPLSIPPSSLHIIPELLRQFVELLEDKTSVEDFVEWGQSVLHTTVKQCRDTNEGDLLQVSKMFILTWKLFTSKISREITLQNAPSFGTFHLIHMLMDDYLLYLLEAELEKQQQRDFRRKILLLRDGEEEPLSEAQVPPVVGNQQPPSLHLPVAGGAVRGGGRVHSSPLPRLDEQLNTFYLSNAGITGHTSFNPLATPSQHTTLESPPHSSSATPISPLHTGTQDSLSRGGMGGGRGGEGGGGGGLGGRGSRSLPESPLLDPGHPPYPLTSQQIASTPPSSSSSLSPSLPLPGPPSHTSSLLPPSNIPLGTTPLSAFPVLSQPLPHPPLPSLSLSSSLSSHPSTSPNHGMTHFVQGLQALNPHQSSSIPFSNHLATASTRFGASLTSVAGSLPNHVPSLPLLPTLYPYGPYGGVGGVPVVQSGPVSVGVVGGGPVNYGSGPPGVLPAGPFPSHSLMPTYSSYISPHMYPGNQINTTPPSS